MITAERVYEVFGITPGPWWSEGEYLAAMVEGKRPNGEIIGRMSPSIHNLFTTKQNARNAKCSASSPEMLVALVNEVISLDCEDILKDIITDIEISEEEKMMIKAIESADSQKRKWPELLKELTKL